MDSSLIALAPFVFLAFVMFLEYRNPLWRQFVSLAGSLPASPDGAQSHEMVFFWKSAETYNKSQDSDYWNAMDVIATNDGLLIKRPFFLFGRRSVFFSWGTLSQGKTFYVWLTKRRAIQISGTELYFTVTERFYKRHVQPYFGSA